MRNAKRTGSAAGTVHLDPVRRRATRGGEKVALTAREYLILAMLMAEPGRLVTRAELEKHLFGAEEEAGSNSVEVHIHNLRRKLGDGLISTVRGRGYRFGPAEA